MIESGKPQKIIWAVGGGKGGTGKSFIAAGLAIALGARTGDIVALDADLGGPNLHTLLGNRNGTRDLGDFLKNRFPRLDEVTAPTAHPGLRLVRGSDSSLFLSNLGHAKKLKLIRQVRNLEARGVIIDLGTGSAYNTLDLFLIAQPGILVVTPEPTSVENAYFFLRSCAGRVLRMYAQFFKMAPLADKLARELEDGGRSLRAFLEDLRAAGGPEGEALLAALRNFRPALIVNKARTGKDLLLGRSMADVASKYFFIDIEVLEPVPFDERVQTSLLQRVPFMAAHPASPASLAIAAAAERLLALPARAEPRAVPRPPGIG